MNLTDNETLKCQRGSPVLLDDICAIYSPKMGEAIDIGYDNFQNYISVLTMTKPLLKQSDDNELRELVDQLTDFLYFLMMMSLDKEVNLTVKKAFKFFTHEEMSFSLDPAQIIMVPQWNSTL